MAANQNTGLTHGSFFTGRGGFDEGAECAGFENRFWCEVDKWCSQYLKMRFPQQTGYNDIRKIESCEKTTVASLGFPCQDISISQSINPEGIFGERSSLFFEFMRIAYKVRFPYIVMENSPMLLKRGFHFVLTAFAEIGYMCEWQCLRASDFGYPHKRERLFVIAYPMCIGRRKRIFRPIETFELHESWTPTETYLRVSSGRLNSFRDTRAIPGNDVVPGFSREIKSYGNAVMPVITEYLFQCIKMDIECN